MPAYFVYGLNLYSSHPLPGLTALTKVNPTLPSVEVWLNSLSPWLLQLLKNTPPTPPYYMSNNQDEGGEAGLRVWQLAEGAYYRLRYSDGTQFVINRASQQIWATWPEELTLEDTTTYLLGPIMALVLRLRGLICLHASAIAIAGQALVIAGPSGAGKSTTAAAFARLGYPVLSDDVVALVEEEQAGTFLVQPAYPNLRLWPDAVASLYGSSQALPRIVPTHPTWDKHFLDLTAPGYQFQHQPLPLAAIYLLGERTAGATGPFIEPISAQAGLLALLANTLASHLLERERRGQEFQMLGKIIKNVPLRQIHPHPDPARLPQLCQTLLEDFEAITPATHPGTGREERLNV